MNNSDRIKEAERALLSGSNRSVSKGVGIIESLAQAGDAKAKYILATWYIHGVHGYEIDIERAKLLLEEASEELVPEACYDLAFLIENNAKGRNKNKDAFSLYLLSAILGDKDAIGEVVRCLYYGVGVYKNKNIAMLIDKISLNSK
jgi:TPR repeat protein